MEYIIIALIVYQLFTNHKKFKQMAKTQAQLAQELRDLKTQNDKARTEVLAKISDLEAAITNAGNTTQEVDDALQALKDSVQTDDDIVADTPTEPTPGEGDETTL